VPEFHPVFKDLRRLKYKRTFKVVFVVYPPFGSVPPGYNNFKSIGRSIKYIVRPWHPVHPIGKGQELFFVLNDICKLNVSTVVHCKVVKALFHHLALLVQRMNEDNEPWSLSNELAGLI
jgi:hypothetical protein